MKTMKIRIPEKIEEKLRLEAGRRGVSLSSIVKEALAAYLGDGKKQDEPKSVYGGMKHLIGSFDGPGDLSTNPKHLEGLGRDSLGYSNAEER